MKIFSSVWLHFKKYFEKYFLVFGCILENIIKNTFSTCCSNFLTFSQLPNKYIALTQPKIKIKTFFNSQTHLIEKERERGKERIGVNGGRRWLDRVGLGVKWSGLVIGGGQISYRWWWPDWLLRSVSSLGLWATRLVVRSRGGNDNGSGWWVVSYRSVTCSSFEFWCSLSGALSLSLSLSLQVVELSEAGNHFQGK